MAGTSACTRGQGCQRTGDSNVLADRPADFEQEQPGGERVGYERIVEQLARDLSARFGREFSRANVFQMRQFYLTCRAELESRHRLDF
jgi:hypothetical protein